MSLGNTFENQLALLIFNATAIANIADNAASAPLTNLYVAFHTASPGETGNATTNECAYTSYARVAVARSGSGWTVTNNVVTPVASIDGVEATGGTETITHFSVTTAASGATNVLCYGTVTPNISVVTGVTPRLTTATTITFD